MRFFPFLLVSIAGVILTGLCFSATPQAQAPIPGPTYEETRDWVVTKINNSAGMKFSFFPTIDETAVQYQNVSMDACQLKYTMIETWNTRNGGGASRHQSISVVVPLAQLSRETEYTKVRWMDQAPYLKLSTQPLTAIHVSGTADATYSAGTHATSMDRFVREADFGIYDDSNGIQIDTPLIFGRPNRDDDIGPRMVKALLHAADLCKAQPPRNNEPF